MQTHDFDSFINVHLSKWTVLHPSEVCAVAWCKPGPVATASDGAFDSVLWGRLSSGVSSAGLCPVTHWSPAESTRPLLVSPLPSSSQVILPRDSQLCTAQFSAAAAAAKSLQPCPTLCDPIDGSPPSSPVPGILQAWTLEWVAISFSSAWKWKVKVQSLGCVQLLATPWTAAYQASPSMGFSRQEYWSGGRCLLRTVLWALSNFHISVFVSLAQTSGGFSVRTLFRPY